jgi:pimeloyl-ACP methyl ester carboxylesterase
MPTLALDGRELWFEVAGEGPAVVLEAAIAGARTAVVPGGAHLLPLEKPDELNPLLLDFLPGA